LEIELPLSETDIDILKALESEGAKTSTRDLSKMLNIPDRTIRYRLNRMREKHILYPPMVLTYERKLGLAEKLLFLRSVPNKEAELKDVLDKIPIFYHYASTYGRFDGFVVYAMFPIAVSHMITRLTQEMKEAGLIKDCYEFDLIDYLRKGADIDTFLSENTWTWQTWYDEIGEVLENGEKLELKFEEFPQVVNFDFKDIQIIMNMIENAEITLKELSELLDLSQPQVHKRIKNLEDNGIIRGYKPSFSPIKDGSQINIVFTSHEHAKEILCAFYRLPFYLTVSMETRNHYFISLSIPSSDTDQFLQGINSLKQYADELFVQTVFCGTSKGQIHLLSTYNEEAKQWDIPVSAYIELIQQSTKGERVR